MKSRDSYLKRAQIFNMKKMTANSCDCHFFVEKQKNKKIIDIQVSYCQRYIIRSNGEVQRFNPLVKTNKNECKVVKKTSGDWHVGKNRRQF